MVRRRRELGRAAKAGMQSILSIARGRSLDEAQVSKWGNSLAIRLPKAAVASLQVRAGEAVDLAIKGGTVIIRAGRLRYTIEELVAAMRPEDEPEPLDDATAPPAGGELL